MEFNQKLQELRKQKGLTQEDLAQALYVSRTAISKWESGRGYPNLDSLKAIAAFFSVSIDELLSGEQVLTLAEEDRKKRETRLRDLVFGLLDCSVVMYLFLPLFGQRANGGVHGVSLLALTGIEPYLRVLYFVAVLGLTAMGILTLALQTCQRAGWRRSGSKLSLALSAVGAILFTVSLQPYAAVFLFVFLVIKALMLIKWP